MKSISDHVRKPIGRMPVAIKNWLQENPDLPWEMCVCLGCERWYAEMDHLAPYHFEQCVCHRCDYTMKTFGSVSIRKTQ